MYNFQGISPKAVELLAVNSFNDNKNFYEENKETLKQLATVPMRKLVTDLSEVLLNLDENIYVNPVYTVSRIRRDTRFSKIKLMYRENMWVMFRRNKNLYRNVPTMWFEFRPQNYSYGIGFFVDKPAHMDVFREHLLQHPDEFKKAANLCEKAGLVFDNEVYKKQKIADLPPDLLNVYNSKGYFEFMFLNTDISNIFSENLVDELKNMIKAVTPMYNFLLDVHNDIVERGL